MDALFLVFVVPTAIVAGVIYYVSMAIIRHRERMAKIEHGIDPDAHGVPPA